LLLLLLLAVSQGPLEVRPEHGLASYLRIAAGYSFGDHAAAVREIREWPPAVIRAAVADVKGRGRQLRDVPVASGDIAFGAIEAAVLMHAEAALLSPSASDRAVAASHLGVAVELFEWSRDEAARRAYGTSPALVPRLDARDFALAVAAAALAAGSPTTALPFAERARQLASFDADAQLVYGLVAEGVAEERALRRRESDAGRWRDQAALALLEALTLGAAPLEASLHLGRLHLEGGRLQQAERLLEEVEVRALDARQRHLARLLLGRLAVRQGRAEEGLGFFRRALEAWPGSQVARLALAQATEMASGPAAAVPVVAAGLAGRPGPSPDPWRTYLYGPPGLAEAAFERARSRLRGP
jgi:tetratricopeptide (TPR) repeat protein